jgi:hypothetical protein
VRLTAFLIAALSITGLSSQAWGFADPVDPSPVADIAPDPVNVVPAPDGVVVEVSPRRAITLSERLAWFDRKTFGIYNFAGALPGAAWNTGLDRPHEAGPHWEGFGERYGVSVATNGLSNGLEAGLGGLWGEDPRYFRAGPELPMKSRLSHIVKWTVLAPGRDGELHPAYARLAAFTGGSFISDAWREPSDATAAAGATRIGLAFLGRMGSNAFDEFWPDAKRKLFHRGERRD